MSPTDCFMLLVLSFWLLVFDVNCKNSQRGYVLRAQAGKPPMGVYNDDRGYRRGSEPRIFRKADYKTSSVDRGQHGNIFPAREDPTTDTKLSQIQSQHPYPLIPERQDSNIPKSQDSHFKSDLNSGTRGRSSVVYKEFTSPDGKNIPQANPESVFSTGAVQVPPRSYRTRPRGFSPVQPDNAPVGFGPNNRKAPISSHSSTTSPNIQGAKSRLKMSHPSWSPRVHSGDLSEARGYAHVRHLKPGSDKTRPQASSAAGRKFFETGFPTVKQNLGMYSHDSTKLGFGLGVPSSSEKQLNCNSRGSHPGSWHPPPPNRPQIPVKGKFKPFQKLPINDDLPAHTNSSESDKAPTQTFAGTTLPPSLNSTGVTSSVIPSATGEFSTNSTSPMQMEGRDAEFTSSIKP